MNTKTELVSVVMPVYNTEEFLAEAIESILSQTYTNFEFIIINDGSTDTSPEIMAKYAEQDKRIKILNQKNSGISTALNNGIAISKGKYIARMDADDISLPERFEKQVQFLENHPDIILLGGDCEYIDKNGKSVMVNITPKTNQDIAIRLCNGIYSAHPLLMFRRTVFDTFYYQQVLAEDYLLQAQCFKHNFANLNVPLLKYRANYGGSLSDTKRVRMLESTKKTSQDFIAKNQHYFKTGIDYKKANWGFLINVADLFARGFFSFSLIHIKKIPRYWVLFPYLVVRRKMIIVLYNLRYGSKSSKMFYYFFNALLQPWLKIEHRIRKIAKS